MSIFWVIGGTSGIGKACVNVLREAPMNNVIATGREVDVRNQDSLLAFLGRKKEFKGPVSHLIYSAGINRLEWSMEVSDKEMLDLYHVNVVGLINVLQVIPTVRRVVVIGSDAAWREMRTSVAYCASKAALHQAVRVIARERASEDFAINVVAPGITGPTGMQRYIDKAVPNIRKWSPEMARRYEESQIPMKRRANVGEIAAIAVTVLLNPTPYLNGAIIPVNGGR
jgi:NAD(P)-dependent dehydrogenase (short-subunit alcohol dehydrogenase family)